VEAEIGAGGLHMDAHEVTAVGAIAKSQDRVASWLRRQPQQQ